MKRITSFARREIPLRVALPWMLLLALLPFWFSYVESLFRVMCAFAVGMFAADHRLVPGVLHNDFITFWSAGHIAAGFHAAHVYDAVWFQAWRGLHLADGLPLNMHYFYPPPNLLLLLITAPFGFLEGFLIWAALLTALGVIVLRRSGMPWQVIGPGVASAAFLLNLHVGQLGFLTGALFICGILAVDRTPRVAGALFGVLAIKPQAGLLGPVVLLARRRYDGITAGAIVTAGLCVAVTLACGWAIWPAYVREGMAEAHRMLVAPFPTEYEIFGASVFWMFRSLGASVALAGIAQLVSASGAVIWCWIAWRRPATDTIALTALTVTLTLLVTPYAYVDDMCGFSLMVAWLAWERRRLDVADVLMWIWPALCAPVSAGLHAELTPLVLLLGALRAWRHLSPVKSRHGVGQIFGNTVSLQETIP